MNKYNIIFLIFILPFILSSCNGDENSLSHPDEGKKIQLSKEEYISIAFDDSDELSKDEIISIVKEFRENVEDSIGTKSFAEFECKVKDKYYLYSDLKRVSPDEFIKVKSNRMEFLPVYEVEIDNTHSTLVSADRRFPSVLTYVNKSKSDMDDKPLSVLAMQELAEHSALFIIKRYNSMRLKTIDKVCKILDYNPAEFDFSLVKDQISTTGVKSTPLEEYTLVGELTEQSSNLARTKTTWNQGAPYNRKLLQACSEPLNEYRYPAGCAVVCIAQVLAHMEPTMLCDGYQMNWTLLKETPQIETSASSAKINQVSALMRFIGANAGAVWDCDGTEMSTKSAVDNFLPQYNIITDGERDLNFNAIKQSLNAGKIVIMTGRTDGDQGHAWILDRYVVYDIGLEHGYPGIVISSYLRANMGWSGSEDGYYLIEQAMDFNTINGVFKNRLKCFTNVRYR